MKILTEISEYPKNVALILGFFDGVHLGHKSVIQSAVDYSRKRSSQTLLITMTPSPNEFFTKKSEYVFNREYSYSLIENLGVDYLLELDFSTFVKLNAQDYLENFLIKNFQPISISSGFNHTFGANKTGNSSFLADQAKKFGYEYFCIPPIIFEEETISSTLIKNYLKSGNIEKANNLLGHSFRLTSKVIEGEKLGRKIGFPTANMEYPQKIVKLPYGVYKVKACDKNAILNWGVKPTVNGKAPLLEVHIPNFDKDIYGYDLDIKFIKRIRDERCFNSIEELQSQIIKDIKECLK